MNALTAAKNKLEEGEKIVQIMQITVYVNSEPDFTKQPKIADFASEYFCEELGESGVGSRAAVGRSAGGDCDHCGGRKYKILD